MWPKTHKYSNTCTLELQFGNHWSFLYKKKCIQLCAVYFYFAHHIELLRFFFLLMPELELHTYIWGCNHFESEDWTLESWAEQHLVKLTLTRSSEKDWQAITMAGPRAPSSRPYRWWIWLPILDVWVLVSSYLTRGLKSQRRHVPNSCGRRIPGHKWSVVCDPEHEAKLKHTHTHTKKKTFENPQMAPNHCSKVIPKSGATTEEQQINDWLVNDGPGCFTSISQRKNME